MAKKGWIRISLQNIPVLIQKTIQSHMENSNHPIFQHLGGVRIVNVQAGIIAAERVVSMVRLPNVLLRDDKIPPVLAAAPAQVRPRLCVLPVMSEGHPQLGIH